MRTRRTRLRIYAVNVAAMVGACLFHWDAADTGILPRAFTMTGLFICYFLLVGSLCFFAWFQLGGVGQQHQAGLDEDSLREIQERDHSAISWRNLLESARKPRTKMMGMRVKSWEDYHPWRFVLASFLSVIAALFFWAVGVTLTGFNKADQCLKRGFTFDIEYLGRLSGAGSRPAIFPLSAPCNAEENLIPFWLNPLIAILLAGAAILIVLSVRCFKHKYKAYRRFDDGI